MKTFVCSLLLLALMIVGIVCNYRYVNKTADKLLELVDALPETSGDGLAASESISAFWKDKMDSVGFSVGYTVLDRISEQAVTLVSAAKNQSEFDYRLSKALLRDAVGDMRRLERFSLGNIF